MEGGILLICLVFCMFSRVFIDGFRTVVIIMVIIVIILPRVDFIKFWNFSIISSILLFHCTFKVSMRVTVFIVWVRVDGV